MEDLAGIAKLADSKLANKVYKDAGTDLAKEVGKTAVDIVRAFRLFLAPFQVAANVQIRLEKWLEDARQRVPAERQIDAQANIVASTMDAIRFEDDTSNFKDYYVKLLASCVDRDSRSTLHPAFPGILRDLSPLDAQILRLVGQCYSTFYGEYDCATLLHAETRPTYVLIRHSMGNFAGTTPTLLHESPDYPDPANLERLKLIVSYPADHSLWGYLRQFCRDTLPSEGDSEMIRTSPPPRRVEPVTMRITPFGVRFRQCCDPVE
jgi:hypothetical protein